MGCRKFKILIVDDEQQIRNAFVDIFQYERYETDTACDGLECLVKVAKNPYDLVLMNIIMPKLDGVATLRYLKMRYPYLPVIICSGYGKDSMIKQVMDLGAYSYVAKPPDIYELWEVAQKACFTALASQQPR